MLTTLYQAFRRLMQRWFTRPVTRLADRFAAAPERSRVYHALSELYKQCIDTNHHKKQHLFPYDPMLHKVIIFSDHHKGARNGADDFAACESSYLAALEYYNNEGFYYINLGDSEELWENSIFSVLRHNKDNFAAERKFADRKAYAKIYGNHDSFWRFDPLAPVYLNQLFGRELRIFGGIVLRISMGSNKHTDIFCTHGHQGDKRSDGNWWSAAFVTYIWGPLQAFLQINTNMPSDSAAMKTLHNQIMYDWSAAQQNLLLITGHTHQPVFNSLTHLERLLVRREHAEAAGDRELLAQLNAEIPKRRQQYPHMSEAARKMKPSYFNSGCCCYSNARITGIELSDGKIRLVKWYMHEGAPTRRVLEEEDLLALCEKLR